MHTITQDPRLGIDPNEIFAKVRTWDIILIMTDAPPIYQTSLLLEKATENGIDGRILKFYPRIILHDWVGFIGEEVDDTNKLKMRYRQAIRSRDVDPLKISLDDFERPENRLIGGDPDPLRPLLFYDDFVHKGRTITSCAEDFSRMGYNPKTMWYSSGMGREIFPLSGLQDLVTAKP